MNLVTPHIVQIYNKKNLNTHIDSSKFQISSSHLDEL
jgi:hypothetical protein